ncbi:coiled-coil domain-containing protein 1-like [Ylistrum balloti]|uniref:coiled-coil domain-containing protein 1-like n=1 Tax=Ylistrum balloti TaxID=509963 RepID=UPI002905D0A3|nr:coiled-coil domain-containing protein 1-like [Ylistrum balloti]
MDRKYFLPKAAVVVMFLSCALSFTIRKRSSPSPSDLNKAFKMLQRQRRRVDMSEYLRNNLDDMQETYDPYEEYGGLDGRYSLEDILPAYQQYLDELEEDGEQEMPNRAPSLDELKSLFGTSDNEHNSVLDEAIKVKGESQSSNRKITKSQMENLLSQVKDEETQDTQEIEKPETSSIIEETGDTDQAEGSSKPEVVTKEELKDIFGGDESSEAKDDTPSDNKDSEEEDSNSTGQEMVPQMNSFPSEKKKKVAKRDNGETLRSEEEDLHNEIALLHLMEGIEDEEIDNLASALKEATMSQMEGADSYLRPEYKDIEKAIRDEEILQELKSNPSMALQMASLAHLARDNGLNVEEEDDEEEDDDSDDIIDKRGDVNDDEKPTYEDGMGRWYENPLPDDDEEIDNKDAQVVLERFVKQYLQSGDANENEIDDVPELQRTNGDTANDEAVRLALSEYLASQGDPNQETPMGVTEESCLAVDLLNTDCEIADKMGLPIDDEARELCNRHEMCYICGKGHGITKSQCDQGFGSEVIEICGPNKSCIRDGAQFLWLIKSGQQYSDRPLDECRDPCVRDYVLGL